MVPVLLNPITNTLGGVADPLLREHDQHTIEQPGGSGGHHKHGGDRPRRRGRAPLGQQLEQPDAHAGKAHPPSRRPVGADGGPPTVVNLGAEQFVPDARRVPAEIPALPFVVPVVVARALDPEVVQIEPEVCVERPTTMPTLKPYHTMSGRSTANTRRYAEKKMRASTGWNETLDHGFGLCDSWCA